MGYLEIGAAILMSITSAAIGEALSWYFVYRTSEYKKKLEHIYKCGDDLAAVKADRTATSKKIEDAENALSEANRSLTMHKFKSSVMVGFVLVTLITTMNSVFEGIPAARLPFEPFAIARGITHRSLFGEDWRECSVMFLYLSFSMAFRQIAQKISGGAPRLPNASAQPALF